MDPAKITGVAEWPVPTTVKQVRSFLGFVNYYRPFVPKFSHVARPLNELTRKGVQFQWGQKEQFTFETLRAKLILEPILRQPQLDQQFEIEVDASGFAIGAVLMQQDQDGKRHPVAYFSATLTEAERNYNIFSLELYAIVRALRHWRAFVAGSPETIIIYTDHANLQYWREPHKVPWWIAREMMELEEYNFRLVHIKGRENGRADALSRWPSYDQGEEDNQGVVVLPDHLFVRTAHTITYKPEEPPQQNEATLKPRINAHDLKKVKGRMVERTTKSSHTRHGRQKEDHPSIPRSTHVWPSRNQSNLLSSVQILLVARNQKGCPRVRQGMCPMSTKQSKYPCHQSTSQSNHARKGSPTLPNNSPGLYHQITHVRRIRFHLDNHRP